MLINSLILFMNGVKKVGIKLHCLLSRDWRSAAQAGTGCVGHIHDKSQEGTLILPGMKSYLATHPFLLSPLCFCFNTKESAPSRRPWLRQKTWAGEVAPGSKGTCHQTCHSDINSQDLRGGKRNTADFYKLSFDLYM